MEPYVYWPASARERAEQVLWMPEPEWREVLRLSLERRRGR